MQTYRGDKSTVQVRDISPETLAALKRRAAASGSSLSEYLRRKRDRLAAVPPGEEVLARIARRSAPTLTSPVEGLERGRSEPAGG